MKTLLVANRRVRKVVALLAAGALIGTLPASAEWRHARGDSRNTSFERVNTSLAVKPRLIHTGPIAPGVNPVIGVSGAVYVGTLNGELRAFRSDGTPQWTRQLRAGTGGVYAAPVVGSDGSIFVVSMVPETEETKVNESFIHKFTPNGDYAWQWSFPKSKRHPFTDTGITTAPPSIWHWNGVEAIIVPVRTKDTTEDTVSLVAFSALGGGLIAHQIVKAHFRGDVTGEWEVPGFEEWLPHCLIGNIPACFMMFGSLGYIPFHEPIFEIPLNGAGIPLPGVAILPDARGGAPLVVATNGIHDKVVYAFSLQTGFQEQARVTNDQRSYVTTPVVDGNGNTLIGTPDGNLTRNGPGFAELASIPFLGFMTAAPTRLNDGSLVVVSREGRVTRIGSSFLRQTPGGESIVSAAASCTHVFISTTDGFYTFDAKNMRQQMVVPWTGGGLSGPVIGPSGTVYTMALDHLWVFPAPLLGGVTGKTACDDILTPKLILQ